MELLSLDNHLELLDTYYISINLNGGGSQHIKDIPLQPRLNIFSLSYLIDYNIILCIVSPLGNKNS